ncbi:hypothetical protein [Companilactobacillus mishanensis]|uniref:CTL/SLC44 family protein n=1 Tax=Companilactobacillus mishanensis TaxID=2486008 RepID=A0A5P0ZIZ9_9LACO|nr:hypothetical protein [Companilactobacillus mishanensis]MQS53070.1 CTL/SLC44 family protein [Companilactobacillus mishanensis]
MGIFISLCLAILIYFVFRYLDDEGRSNIIIIGVLTVVISFSVAIKLNTYGDAVDNHDRVEAAAETEGNESLKDAKDQNENLKSEQEELIEQRDKLKDKKDDVKKSESKDTEKESTESNGESNTSEESAGNTSEQAGSSSSGRSNYSGSGSTGSYSNASSGGSYSKAEYESTGKRDLNTHKVNAETGQVVGNTNSKIYHVLGQKGYNMAGSHARYFDTEQEAINAGYRRSLK